MLRSERREGEPRFRKDLCEAAEIQFAECCTRQGGAIAFRHVRTRREQILSAVDCIMINGDRPFGVSKSLWREVLIFVAYDMDAQDKVTFGRRGTCMRMATDYRLWLLTKADRQRENGRKQYVGKGRKPQFTKRPMRRRFEPQLA